MLQLAQMFETGGLGIAPSEHDAFQCHILASELGQMLSKCIMGEYYERGIVVKRNGKKARDCYRAAVRSGDSRAQARAQYNLARIQYYGLLGQKQDQRNARILWEMAAMKHHQSSQAAVGYCHEKGLGGLNVDISAAKRFYTSAANQGCGRSAFNLGRLYEKRLLKCDGNDEQRRRCSLHWYERALALGYAHAADRLKALSNKLPESNDKVAEVASDDAHWGEAAPPGQSVDDACKQQSAPAAAVAGGADAESNGGSRAMLMQL